MRFILLLALMLNLLNAEPREALLIGNYKYKYISTLDNPTENLKRLKESLESVGFNVTIKSNLNSEKLEEAIDLFKGRLARDKSTIGFLYYTGHGCQVDYQGYLIPTNVNTQFKRKIKYNALNINEMLEVLKEANNQANLLFLDACRDVPTGAKGGTKGLAQPNQKPIGTLLVYATEAGKIASDNSKFINALIENINKPNQTVESMGSSISRTVAKRSNFIQVPEVYAKLLPEDLVLKGGGGHGGGDGDNHPMKGITKLNGLMYQNQPFSNQDKSNFDNQKSGGRVWDWQGAKDYCEALTLGNYTDWRLPSRSELKKLLTKTKYKNSKGFEYCIKEEFVENMPPLTGKYKSASFWSSTERDSSYVCYVGFFFGNDGCYLKSSNYYALCVR